MSLVGSVLTLGVGCWGRARTQDITGNIGSPQASGTSLSPGMRTALFHLVFDSWDPAVAAQFYTLGDNSYFSESGYMYVCVLWGLIVGLAGLCDALVVCVVVVQHGWVAATVLG